MPDKFAAIKSRIATARRVLISVGVGAAIAAAVAAIVGPLVTWAVRASTDHTSPSLTGTGVVAMAIGVCVLTVIATSLLRQSNVAKSVGVIVGFVALALGAWSVWNGFGLYRSLDTLSFVDSTGATIIAAAATVAAIVAVVLGLGLAGVAHTVSGRMVVCAFLVVALVVPLLTYRSVQDHRTGVWYPDLTAAASVPAAVPDAIGAVRYRMPLDAIDNYTPDIYAAGNGFLVDTRRGLTAYDGPTGAKRWHVGHYGIGGRPLVVHRDRDDTTGIVVLSLYFGLIALDASSGEVLWRRQFNPGGELTAMTGSIDALGMTVFTAHAAVEGPDRTRTRFLSLDPATGQLRFSQPISCSNPTLTPGTAGQFGIGCDGRSIMDAHTGKITDVPGDYPPTAGTDAYVVATAPPPDDDPGPKDVTQVMDPAGKIIDEVPGTYPVSQPHDGLLLVYGGGDTWVLRDYRNHRSTTVPIHLQAESQLKYVEAIWLKDRLLFTNKSDNQRRLQLVDLTRPTEPPTVTKSPCSPDQLPWGVHAVAGAIVVECLSDAELIGLVPEHR